MTIAPEKLTTDAGREAMERVDDAIAALKAAGFEFFIAVEPEIFDGNGDIGIAMTTHASARVHPNFLAIEDMAYDFLRVIFGRRGMAPGVKPQHFVIDADGTARERKGH